MDYVSALGLVRKKSLDFGPLFFQIGGGPDLQLRISSYFIRALRSLFVLSHP